MSSFSLGHPVSTVIGAKKPYRMAVFLSVLGCEAQKAPTLESDAAKALYGLEESCDQLLLTTPGAEGTIRIVETPHEGEAFEPLVAGSYGVDFYATDIHVSMALAKEVGADVSPLVCYYSQGTLAPSTEPQYEVRYTGPEGMSVFITDTPTSAVLFPTILDRESDRLHSELNMLCWVTTDPDRERDFWTQEAGLDLAVDVLAGADGMKDLMAHPSVTPLRCVNVADKQRQRRMEFMAYPEENITRQRADWPLRGGLHAAVFQVDDIDEAMRSMPSARFGEPCSADQGSGRTRAVGGVSPTGIVRFELWETT